MKTYSGTCVLTEIVKDVLVQFFPEHTQECSLRSGKEGLTYAAALIEEMVVGYSFLIFVPKTVHSLISL